jgi:hypothetical protein
VTGRIQVPVHKSDYNYPRSNHPSPAQGHAPVQDLHNNVVYGQETLSTVMGSNFLYCQLCLTCECVSRWCTASLAPNASCSQVVCLHSDVFMLAQVAARMEGSAKAVRLSMDAVEWFTDTTLRQDS